MGPREEYEPAWSIEDGYYSWRASFARVDERYVAIQIVGVNVLFGLVSRYCEELHCCMHKTIGTSNH